MKNFLKVVKPVCAILFFISIAYIFYYKSFTDKTGGSTLNNETKIIDGRYYLADNKGNTKEIDKALWDEHVIKGKIFNVSVHYLEIYLIYICYKFLIIPNMKRNKDDTYN